MKRIAWIDIAKFIGIYFVMISHLECNTTILSIFYSPFFLCIFYFCAGYVYKSGEKFSKFLYKKIRQLLIPWFVFGTFNIFLRNVISFNAHVGFWNEMKDNLLQAGGDWNELWFVAALFISFIPFYFLIKLVDFLNKKTCYAYLICIVVGIVLMRVYDVVISIEQNYIPYPWNSIWHIPMIGHICYYMLLGYSYRHYFENKIKCLGSASQFILKVAGITAYIACITVDYAKIDILIPNWIMGNIKSILGVMVVVIISKMISENAFMQYCGQNTLIFFAFHGKAYSVIQNILKRVIPQLYGKILENSGMACLFSMLFSLALSVVLLVPSWIINRWFPFVVGRKKQVG